MMQASDHISNDKLTQDQDATPRHFDTPPVASDGKSASGGLFRPYLLNKRAYLVVIGVFTLAGVLGGYAYYSLVGCKSGGCAITSSPTLSIIWGGLMGYLIPDFFVKEKKS